MYRLELYDVIGRDLPRTKLWPFFSSAVIHNRVTGKRLDFLNANSVPYHVVVEIAPWSRHKEVATWYACIEDEVQAVLVKLSLDALD